MTSSIPQTPLYDFSYPYTTDLLQNNSDCVKYKSENESLMIKKEIF